MYGATYAGRIWQDYMNQIHQGMDKEDFIKPDTIQKKYISGDGSPTNVNTGKQDYFSAYGESKRSLLEQQREEKKAEKRAEDIVAAFEAFDIVKVEDCYEVEKKYKKALNAVAGITNTDVQVALSTRVADKYDALQKELKNWKDAMAAYEIEQARKQAEEKEKAKKEAEKAEKNRKKTLAIERFKNAIRAVQETTEEVTEYTYTMLNQASKYLSQCVDYSEYDELLALYNSEKERIEKLAAKNEADRIAQEQQAQAEEAAREKRVKKDQERVAQEKAQSGNP